MVFEICHYVISQHVTHKMSKELHANAIIEHVPFYLLVYVSGFLVLTSMKTIARKRNELNPVSC